MPALDSLGQKLRNGLHLGRALRLVWQSTPGWTVASVALLVVQGALPLASLYLLKLVVDAVIAGLAAADRGATFRQVALLIGGIGAVNILNALCGAAAGLVGEQRSQVFADYMSDVLHAKSVQVDLEYYESPQYYDTLHRAQQQGTYRPNHIVDGLVRVAQNGISMLGVAGLLTWLHWDVALVLFVSVLPGILVRVKYAHKVYQQERDWTPAERKSWYLGWLLTGDQHAKEVRLFNLGPTLMGRFRELRRQLRHERLALAGRRAMANLGTQVLAALALFGSYALIAYRTIRGAITPGELVMYLQAFQRGQDYLREVLRGLADLYEDTLYLSNLYEFLDLEPKVAEPPRPRPVPRPMTTGIVFDHVHFRYPTGSRPVLQDINLTVRPGEHVALVGENGSGKTTLIKLLCRLYDPLEGQITFDGTDLRLFGIAALRQEIGVIFQDYVQYHLTARENVWLGNVDLPPDHEQIAVAARYAGADEVISRLPHGYETVLGKWFEDGEELSIGEWQKVALARAFLREAPILVLDEPTSALDARAEYQVFETFRQLAAGRTAILISHRFSTVRLADRIYVLNGGRIVESGTHTELMNRGGTYARLFEMQAQYYR
jgi:ATP-binding cassette subfamily B protein